MESLPYISNPPQADCPALVPLKRDRELQWGRLNNRSNSLLPELPGDDTGRRCKLEPPVLEPEDHEPDPQL